MGLLPTADRHNDSETPNNDEIPLPSDLKRILREVAGSGDCTWLSWDNNDTDLVLNSVLEKPRPWPHQTTDSSTHQHTSRAYFTSSRPEVPRRKRRKTVSRKTSQQLWVSRDPSSIDAYSKRPPLVIKTLPHMTADTNHFPALSPVGDGRTSGSEPDGATHYEWDSEGSATSTNSDSSSERLRMKWDYLKGDQPQTIFHHSGSPSFKDNQLMIQAHRTLQEVFRIALVIVLDHFYQNRGGYKVSPAEKGKKSLIGSSRKIDNDFSVIELPLTPEDIFIQRRQRLVDLLQPRPKTPNKAAGHQNMSDGPPFTIQRIAEVLIAPERVSQCLHSLLLVSLHLG